MQIIILKVMFMNYISMIYNNQKIFKVHKLNIENPTSKQFWILINLNQIATVY